MNKELEKICAKKNYDKVLAIIESKTSKPSLVYKDLHLSNTDLEYLKRYARDQTMSYLYRGESVIPSLLNLARLLSYEYSLALKTEVTNYIISQSLADTGQYIALNFIDLTSLPVVYEYIETEADAIEQKHASIPAGWNLSLKFVCKAIVMVKQQICDCFFIAEPEEEPYIKGLLATIGFEKKLESFFITQKCCDAQIDFSGSEIDIKPQVNTITCVHMRMLSALFVPYVGLYLNSSLKSFATMALKQQEVEMGIILTFLKFFRAIEEVYERLSYFEDQSVFKEMLLQIDHYLCSFVKKIKVSSTLEGGIVVFTTIIYIREVLQDLIARVVEYFGVNLTPCVLNEMIKIEHYQSWKTEQAIANGFPVLLAEESNAEKLKAWFVAFIDEIANSVEDVQAIIIEMAIGYMFGKIGQLKMTVAAAEHLLSDVEDLEQHIGSTLIATPHIQIIKDYLRIFTCPTIDSKKFVENFNHYSNGVFSFNQILAALKDQTDTADLFLVYKQSYSHTI